MFGLSDNKKQPQNNNMPGPQGPMTGGPMPAPGGPMPSMDQPSTSPLYNYSSTVVPSPQPISEPLKPAPLPSSPFNNNHQMVAPPAPATPIKSQSAMPSAHDSPVHSASSSMQSVNLDNAYITTDPTGATPAKTNDPPSAASLVASDDQDKLMEMKTQALQNLSPLINKLDQTPEEKFKTTMQMIQASDNPQLIQEAYDAANKISDEKTKAQALLDIVNEINYFTHPNTGTDPAK